MDQARSTRSGEWIAGSTASPLAAPPSSEARVTPATPALSAMSSAKSSPRAERSSVPRLDARAQGVSVTESFEAGYAYRYEIITR